MATESETKTKTDTQLDTTAEAGSDKDTTVLTKEEPEDKVPAADEAGPEETEAGAKADDAAGAETDAENDEEADEELSAPSAKSGGWGAGAGAVVSAGLGLASLVGTPLSEMLRERKQLIGQIESSSQQGAGGDPVNAVYGAPWHATAMINGIFAVLAVVVGGVLLAVLANRSGTRSWVKALCLGGLVLGVVGLLVAGGMYFDLFASQPDAPTQQPQMPAQ